VAEGAAAVAAAAAAAGAGCCGHAAAVTQDTVMGAAAPAAAPAASGAASASMAAGEQQAPHSHQQGQAPGEVVQQQQQAGAAEGAPAEVDELQVVHNWAHKCQELADKVKQAMGAAPAPSGAWKIAGILKCGILTGELGGGGGAAEVPWGCMLCLRIVFGELCVCWGCC
jgi:hypothetical protein